MLLLAELKFLFSRESVGFQFRLLQDFEVIASIVFDYFAKTRTALCGHQLERLHGHIWSFEFEKQDLVRYYFFYFTLWKS